MRRWEGWLATMLELLAVAGVLAMPVRWLERAGWMYDASPDRRYTLPPEARAFVRSLAEPVQLVAFVRSGLADPTGMSVWLPALARESPQIRMEVLDIDREPTRARRYGVNTAPTLVVASARRQRVLANPELPVVISYMAAVTRATVPRVYASAGGQHRAADYRRVTDMLHTEGFAVEWRSLPELEQPPAHRGEGALAGDGTPGDESAAAPVMWLLFDPDERDVARIEALDRAGARLLLAVEPETCRTSAAFCRWLAERFGIRVGLAALLDPRNRMAAGDPYTLLAPGLAADHPITAALLTPVLLSQATPVEWVGVDDAAARWTLLYAARSARLEWVGGAVAGGFEPATDGPIPVAVAGVGRSGVRFVVVGDADFATDRFVDYAGNRDFLINAANWLAQEHGWFGRRPPLRAAGVQLFFLSAGEAERLLWMFAVGEPLLLAVCGLIVWWRRRRR